MTREEARELIFEWKFFWMNQTQNSKEDFENYHRRAFGVDANMIWDLAQRISDATNAKEENCQSTP